MAPRRDKCRHGPRQAPPAVQCPPVRRRLSNLAAAVSLLLGVASAAVPLCSRSTTVWLDTWAGAEARVHLWMEGGRWFTSVEVLRDANPQHSLGEEWPQTLARLRTWPTAGRGDGPLSEPDVRVGRFGYWHFLMHTEGGIAEVWDVGVPWWSATVILSIWPAVWVRRRWLTRLRRVAGLCPACGYDLRATPDRCPECGTVPTAAVPPKA